MFWHVIDVIELKVQHPIDVDEDDDDDETVIL